MAQMIRKKLIKILEVYIVVFILLFAPVSFAQNGATPATQAFFENISDIPLMNNMEEMKDSAVIFDTPAGRIIESAAVAQGLEKNLIETFYNQSLPQLGWTQTGHNAFSRNGEKLYLEVEEGKEYNILFLRVEPSR